MNRAQRLWLAAVLPVLVLIPFWWDTYHIESDVSATPYLALVTATATLWAVLSLLDVRPWNRLPKRLWIVAAPPIVAALTLVVILVAHRSSIDNWRGITWGVGFAVLAWVVFREIRTFGKRGPTEGTQLVTYGLIGFFSVLQFFDENYLWRAFGPRNLPFWFASLVLLTGLMLWLLRTSAKGPRARTIIDITPEPSSPDQHDRLT